MYNQNTLSERVLLLHSELLILFHHYVLFFTYKKKQIKMYLDVKNVTGPTGHVVQGMLKYLNFITGETHNLT